MSSGALLFGLGFVVLFAVVGFVLVPAISGHAALAGSGAPSVTAIAPTPVVYQVMLVAAPTTEPPPVLPALAIYGVNQRISVGGLVFQVLPARAVKLSDVGLADDPARAILVVDVQEENYRQGRRATYGPDGFRVRDSDGYEYLPTSINAMKSLKSGELNFGERVRGEVYFPIATAAKGLELVFTVSLSADPRDYQTVRVPVGS